MKGAKKIKGAATMTSAAPYRVVIHPNTGFLDRYIKAIPAFAVLSQQLVK